MVEWLEVKGYEGKYSISEIGNVRSEERVGIDKNNRKFPIKQRFLTNKLPNGAKYYQILLYSGQSNYKLKRIHRLVAEAFIPNPLNLPEVNHKDGNKLNNHKDNLEWCTKSENMLHSFNVLDNGKGIKHYASKLKVDQVKEILTSELSQVKLAKKYKVSKGCIQQIKERKSWKHIKI